MVEISNITVSELKESVIACRNAMRTEMPEYTEEEFDKSLPRAIKLVEASRNGVVKCHDNFLTGIRVSFDIVYPQYFTPQLQRYHFIDIVSSSSKDHRLSRIMEANCYNKYVSEEVKASVQKYLDAYNANPSYENHMILLSNCPLGLQLFMRCSTNYMSLRNLYHQRIHDKLKEDWGAVLDMIRNLPYAEDFITLGK